MHVKGGFYFNYLSNPPIMGTGTIQYIFTLYTRSPPQYLGCHSNTFCSFSSSFSLHFSPASSLHHLVSCKLHVLHEPKSFPPFPPYTFLVFPLYFPLLFSLRHNIYHLLSFSFSSDFIHEHFYLF